jgi:hypothetical protein
MYYPTSKTVDSGGWPADVFARRVYAEVIAAGSDVTEQYHADYLTGWEWARSPSGVLSDATLNAMQPGESLTWGFFVRQYGVHTFTPEFGGMYGKQAGKGDRGYAVVVTRTAKGDDETPGQWYAHIVRCDWLQD